MPVLLTPSEHACGLLKTGREQLPFATFRDWLRTLVREQGVTIEEAGIDAHRGGAGRGPE